MLSSRVKVMIPEKGVVQRRIRNGKYAYLAIETFRNEAGKPDNKRVSIGKIDETDGLLIPNDNYYKYCDNEIAVTCTESVKSVGSTFLTEAILKNSGASEIINQVFGKKDGAVILEIAKYMSQCGNVTEYISDWCNNSLCDLNLTPQYVSNFYKNISDENRLEFFKLWVSKHDNLEDFWAYDVTSFSTYAKEITDAEFGYNRDKEKLPQINFGCYFSQLMNLPMFYTTYSGSIVDKTHFKYMLQNNEELGVKAACFVMDAGFCTKDNLSYLKGKHQFIFGTEITNKSISSAIDVVRSEITLMRNRTKFGEFTLPVAGVFYGVRSTAHIYFNQVSAANKYDALERSINKSEQKLKSFKTITPIEAKSFYKYFDIFIKNDGTFLYNKNFDKIDKIAKNYGFFCLLTDTAHDGENILQIYRNKDVIEKAFDDVKNQIDMKRMRTHTSATTNGKLFCAFIALIIVTIITNLAGEYLHKHSMSRKSMFIELDKIRIATTASGQRLLNPLTKHQRELLQLFSLSDSDLLRFISR